MYASKVTDRAVIEATWRAFSQSWKIHLQALADEIDQTFVIIKDIAQYHGLLERHINLIVGQGNLMNSQKTIAMQAQSLDRLDKLEDMMEASSCSVYSLLGRARRSPDS